MPNPIPTEQIRKALLEKGFVPVDDRNHTFYYFYYNEKKTVARTKISRGSSYRNYDDSLFVKMRTQLQLDTVRQVRALLECPMSREDYIAELKKRRRLGD